MRKLIYSAFVAAVVLSLGCAITNYPVIFDSRGPYDNQVETTQYNKAYIIPSSDIAFLYANGSDNLYSQVAQDWKGDQWLYTFNNFDASALVNFLDNTYCDPTRQSNCAIWTAWNPDLPDAYPHGSQSAPYDTTDNPFDGVYDVSCSGARSLSSLISYSSRFGECGSGIWADKQSLAYEFANLQQTVFHGQNVYSLPFDTSNTNVAITGQDGATATLPLYGTFHAYVDQKLRTMVPVTPNAKYELRWATNWINAHGHFVDASITYGSLTTNAKIKITTLNAAMNRI